MHNSAFDVLGLSSISLGKSNSLIFSTCNVNSTHLVGDINKTESDDEASDEDLLSWKAIASIGIACSTSFLLGYDEGIMSGAVSTLQATLQLTDIQTNVMMGSLNFMAAFGTLLSSHVADKYGRAIGLCWTSIQLLIGPLLMATANLYTRLMIGRVVTGFGCGFALTVAPLYAAELAPKQLRGSLIAMAELCNNFGVFVGYTLAYFLAHLPDRYDWRVMVGVAISIPLGILLMLPFVPETPRWLKMKAARAQNERNESNASRTSGSTDVQILDFYHDVEKDYGSNHSAAIDGLAIGSWRDVLYPKVETRRMLAAGMGIAIFQQICGSEATVYYTPNIFVSAV